MTCSQPQAHPDRCGCQQAGPQPVGYVYNVDGTLEFNTFCLRHYYRSKYAEHEHDYIQPQAVYTEPPAAQVDVTELDKRDVEIAVLTAELERLKAAHDHIITQATDQLKTANKLIRSAIDYRENDVWFWQGDGSDRPETLAIPIIIQPTDMIAVIQDEQEFSRFLIENGGLMEAWAREWKPDYHPPLCDWLEERLRVYYRRTK